MSIRVLGAAVEAVTLARLAVADAFVGALRVKVTLAGIGVRALLHGTPRIRLGSRHYRRERAEDEDISVQVAFGRVDVHEAEVACALRAVVALGVLVAAARVLGTADAVAIAGVWALGCGIAQEGRKPVV